MKKSIFIISLFTLATFGAAAQNATLFNVPSDPVSAALGGATAVLKSTPYAVSNNPAVMSISQNKTKFGVSYASWAPQTSAVKTIGIAGYGRIKKFGIGADIKILNQNEYQLMSADGTVLGTFKPSNLSAAIGVSYAILDGLSVGVTGKFLNSKLTEKATTNAFGIDVMAMYKIRGLRLALGATDLASEVASAKIGVGYSIAGFTVLADARYIFKNSVMASVGAEYSLLKIADFRFGYHFGNGAYAVPSYFSAGIGIGLPFVKINGTYLFGSESLKNTFLVGLAFAF